MIVVLEAADAPGRLGQRWQHCLLALGLRFEGCLQLEPILLVLMANLVDIHISDGGRVKEEVVLVLTEESNTVLALADRKTCVGPHLSVEDLGEILCLRHRLTEI